MMMCSRDINMLMYPFPIVPETANNDRGMGAASSEWCDVSVLCACATSKIVSNKTKCVDMSSSFVIQYVSFKRATTLLSSLPKKG